MNCIVRRNFQRDKISRCCCSSSAFWQNMMFVVFWNLFHFSIHYLLNLKNSIHSVLLILSDSSDTACWKDIHCNCPNICRTNRSVWFFMIQMDWMACRVSFLHFGRIFPYYRTLLRYKNKTINAIIIKINLIRFFSVIFLFSR